jgi:hypothetical protein
VPAPFLVPDSSCSRCLVSIPLPFPYQLYDTRYSAVIAANNGTLQFTGGNASPDNTCLPAPGFTDTIFAYWDDFLPQISGLSIYTSVTGTAPDRIFTIAWQTVKAPTNAAAPIMEVRLMEDQTRFEIIYGNGIVRGLSVTVGVQGGDGARYRTQYVCDSMNTLQSGLRLTFDRRSCAGRSP